MTPSPPDPTIYSMSFLNSNKIQFTWDTKEFGLQTPPIGSRTGPKKNPSVAQVLGSRSYRLMKSRRTDGQKCILENKQCKLGTKNLMDWRYLWALPVRKPCMGSSSFPNTTTIPNFKPISLTVMEFWKRYHQNQDQNGKMRRNWSNPWWLKKFFILKKKIECTIFKDSGQHFDLQWAKNPKIGRILHHNHSKLKWKKKILNDLSNKKILKKTSKIAKFFSNIPATPRKIFFAIKSHTYIFNDIIFLIISFFSKKHFEMITLWMLGRDWCSFWSQKILIKQSKPTKISNQILSVFSSRLNA